ncbi:MAG: hypothetical protein MUC34_05410 [Anaerolineae bacterium]|nr:hypothetical protein [Anaerolineae bacterium]
MRKPHSLVAGAAATLIMAFLMLLLPVATFYDAPSYADRLPSGPGGHGCKEGNLIPNCGMDNFVPVPQGSAPAGWTPFVVSGGLAMDASPDTYWGAPSLRMWSDGGTFVAGIYTQVGGLTPGATYYASMGWGGPTEPDAFGRRLGIDPTGGTDPNSPNVVWMQRGPGKVLNDSNPGFPNIDVSAVAKGSTVTVFVWVDHNYSTGQNQIFIDAVGLYPSGAPIAPPPTNTLPPPPPSPTAAQVAKAAATRVPATATAVPPTATLPPTETPTPAPTDTPAPTATPTLTATPTQTLTPSVTPSSTLPPRPRATVAPESRAVEVAVSSATAPPQALLFGGIGALAGAALLGVLVAVRRR